ncbi:Threonine aldolase [Entomortierella beljakovae]|nr:Threonine aldolase [Entomortierella beljakovae]
MTTQKKSVNPLPYTDFRSDTATAPTEEMFAAMRGSSLGDDVYNEDDSVKKLESFVAQLTGHEAALFCCSGTMSNQLAHRVHLCNPPQSAMVDIRSHVFNYEAGGISFLSQALVYPVMPSNGRYLTAEDVATRIVQDVDVHFAPTRVVSLENTLNGTIMPIEEIARVRELTQQYGIKLHLDGARIWHASAATGISLREYCSYFDTVSLCLSKGIGAPVGSILVGSTASIKKARHFRLLFGGGWRQAGILAEAALWGIETNWPTMKDSHRRAKTLESAFIRVGCHITNPVDTNMVWVNTSDAGFTVDVLMAELSKEGIKISGSGYEARVVLHYQICDDAVNRFIQVLNRVARPCKKSAKPLVLEKLEGIFKGTKQGGGEDDEEEEEVEDEQGSILDMPNTPASPVVGHEIINKKTSTSEIEESESESISNRKALRRQHHHSMPDIKPCHFGDSESHHSSPSDENEITESIPNVVPLSNYPINNTGGGGYSVAAAVATGETLAVTPKDGPETMVFEKEQSEQEIPPPSIQRSKRSQSLNHLSLASADKKVSKLQNRMAQNPASKALKRAGSRFTKWSSSLLAREA